ncbi:hypothetical protein [uncultured Clostridium sp.]|uniref:hypothetical protein n=1 Tax=uncultured Clostridium sp. TaxID=59620 RepID=UPI0025E7DB73|nr:hypothetical protein [uncultured Clostridium sp.]
MDNDNIYQYNNFSNQKTLIGVSVKKYNELKEIADKYYNILVEKNIIEKPKTQEDLMSEMLKQMKEMQEEIKSLKNKNDRPVLSLKKEEKNA